MKKFSLIFIFLFGVSFASIANSQDDRVVLVYGMLHKYHYAPRPLDDSLSADIYTNFFKSIDPFHLYFTQEDMDILSAYKFSLDDEIKVGNLIFLYTATEMLRVNLHRTDSLISDFLSKPFDYNENEWFVYDVDKYPEGQKNLQARLRQYLKLRMLYRLSTAGTADSLNDPKIFESTESKLRAKVLATEHRKLLKIIDNPEGFTEYICSDFCNAMATAFDPHSNFFPNTDRENFMSHVTTESKSFGIRIKSNKGDEIYIDQLIPGGAAWKSGQLHDGDVLLSVKWSEETIDLNGASVEEVTSILSSFGDQTVEFTVRDKSGIKTVVPLKKEKISTDDNIVKSFVLKGDTKSIGYITLPAFYARDASKEGSSCASDVGKEVLKLSKEKIDGLILDLRYNGGGSLDEALHLAGIFVNEGVLGIERSNEGKPYMLRDPNRGTMYDGPLVVMVNAMTASASELVAASLQDYNRAIIVGARTYGKATAQVVLPVDTTLNMLNLMSMKEKSGYGYVKVTIGKLYRSTGKTNQFLGTTPDIELPDIYAMLKFREEFSKNALKPDTIKRAAYTHPYNPLPINYLAEKSKSRTAGNKNFIGMVAVAKKMAALQEYRKMEIPLKMEDFFKLEKAMHKNFEEAKDIGKDSTQNIYKVSTLTADKLILQSDDIRQFDYNNILKDISSDIYISEAFMILNDLANIQK